MNDLTKLTRTELQNERRKLHQWMRANARTATEIERAEANARNKEIAELLIVSPDPATERLDELTGQGMTMNKAARKVQRELGSQW